MLEWFDEVRVAARFPAAFALREIIARAHRNDEGRQLSPEGKFPQQFPAVPARQTDVRDQGVEPFVGGPGQSRAGVGGERAAVPEEFQDEAQHGERVRMILNHKDVE